MGLREDPLYGFQSRCSRRRAHTEGVEGIRMEPGSEWEWYLKPPFRTCVRYVHSPIRPIHSLGSSANIVTSQLT